jgi:hypothetical protein
LCEGFLGIDLHFELWRYFFAVSLHKRVEREGKKERVQGASGKHEHPSSGELGGVVHVTLVDNIKQRVA